jgi:hypothetical protein
MILNYIGKNIFVCEGVKFFSSEVKVTEDQLKKLIKNSLFRWRVDKGIIQVPNYASYIKEEEKAAETEQEIRSKIHTINTNFSVESIKKLAKKEKNHRIIDAADLRIAHLEQKEAEEKILKNPLSSIQKPFDQLDIPNQENNFKAEAGLMR